MSCIIVIQGFYVTLYFDAGKGFRTRNWNAAGGIFGDILILISRRSQYFIFADYFAMRESARLHDSQTNVDNLSVKLCISVFSKLHDSISYAHCRAVGSIIGHGVKRICHGQNA
jgi:hypothetical protein